MRVLQLIDSLNPGGAERVAVSYANALLGAVEASFLCSTRAEGKLKAQLDSEVGYLFLKKRSAADLLALMRLIRFCKRNKIDVIHAHATSFFTARLAVLFLGRCQLIWHDHYGNSETLEQRPLKVLAWCSNRFNTVLAVNQKLADWAKEFLKAEQVLYLENAVPMLDADRIEAVELPGTTGYRILQMANFRPQKDHSNALRALAEVRKTLPEVSLHLLGMNWQDPYYQEVLALIESLEISTAVHLHGSQQDVNGYMKACDVGLLSSQSEGLPMAVLEYAAMDLPVVCTRVGQCEELVGSAGYTVPASDPAALANALVKALKQKEESKKKAQDFKKQIAKRYSIQTIIPKLLAVYGKTY
ncbi:glycosyltransferase [Gilvibacter sediminis]|uniref:glycosyltransferase n=1 Tax=Gilvibacter sediminis TaxID=379071 RepID=UPI002350B54C|nr:glycosyltransferase [Gilvibacter sediminis]MDC7999247.1 glycosyltransferase [Gilvibacter sediminis]